MRDLAALSVRATHNFLDPDRKDNCFEVLLIIRYLD
jgi:hypothetical protein